MNVPQRVDLEKACVTSPTFQATEPNFSQGPLTLLLHVILSRHCLRNQVFLQFYKRGDSAKTARMGIKQLFSIIKEEAPEAIKEGEIKNHFGRKVAIVSPQLLQYTTLHS